MSTRQSLIEIFIPVVIGYREGHTNQRHSACPGVIIRRCLFDASLHNEISTCVNYDTGDDVCEEKVARQSLALQRTSPDISCPPPHCNSTKKKATVSSPRYHNPDRLIEVTCATNFVDSFLWAWSHKLFAESANRVATADAHSPILTQKASAHSPRLPF